MAFQKSSDASNATRKNPSLLEIGALCLDSEIIFGFTSHLLRRKARVAEGSGVRELSPRKRPPAAAEEERCASRPPPEGAGAAAGTEPRPLERAAAGGWCRSCQAQLAELRRQAARLAAGGCPPNAPPTR
ncbi:hypothetical protein DV515_00001915 [Chloebia gouldiae]|uniref:Uncharacterized protein n=1 Tax=Chloebia gouldiae TaxID=44316 RepID=A0A3L8SWY2_CHLGU|nr:hypothetical protein DV515_00001915 [Chloebia gouldiae]